MAAATARRPLRFKPRATVCAAPRAVTARDLGGGAPQRCPAPGQCADLSLAAAHTKGGGYYGD
eukprot:gene13425-4292_t